MTGFVNKVFLLGALGRDPEIRSMQSGEKIANMSLATSESWKDRQSGERRERTDWHRITVFNQHLVTIIERYVSKGMRLHIEGEIRTRKYTGKDGIERMTTEVVLPKFGGSLVIVDGRRGSDAGEGYQDRQPAQTKQRGKQRDDLDYEIPF